MRRTSSTLTLRVHGRALALAAGLVGAAAAVALAPPAGQGSPGKPSPEQIARGQRNYSIYCASCHGVEGKGDGPVAADLAVRPTDLTRLAHDGVFPRDEVTRAIDGRDRVRAHGPAAMPVWGLTFQGGTGDAARERDVQQKIEDLVAFLESIQVEASK